jgi:hypothetical protein
MTSHLPELVTAPAEAVRQTPSMVNGILTRPTGAAEQDMSANLFPDATTAADHADLRAMKIALGFLAAGFCSYLIGVPVGMILLVTSASMYFCKGTHQRTQLPRQGRVAYMSLFFCLLWVVVLGLRHRLRFRHYHHGRHHHDGRPRHDGPNHTQELSLSYDYDYEDYYDVHSEWSGKLSAAEEKPKLIGIQEDEQKLKATAKTDDIDEAANHTSDSVALEAEDGIRQGSSKEDLASHKAEGRIDVRNMKDMYELMHEPETNGQMKKLTSHEIPGENELPDTSENSTPIEPEFEIRKGFGKTKMKNMIYLYGQKATAQKQKVTSTWKAIGSEGKTPPLSELSAELNSDSVADRERVSTFMV